MALSVVFHSLTINFGLHFISDGLVVIMDELLKLKKSLKVWETEFYKQHGKKPGKVRQNN